MKEIASDIYIETTFAGVTLAAIRLPHGVVFIDSPLLNHDAQAWRASFNRPGSSSDRLLILLDEHPDRSIGAKAMKCTTIAHEKAAIVLSNRPISGKPAAMTGSIWEHTEDLGSIHWLQPEITFTHSMFINWGEEPIELEYRGGPSKGAAWVIVPSQKVLFVGDAVLLKQPPFLASADLEAWLETLNQLHSAKYRDFILISGRGELITQEDIKIQINFLKQTQTGLKKMARHNAEPNELERLAFELAKEFPSHNKKEEEIFKVRLSWGVMQNYNNHFQPSRQMVEQ